MNTEVIQGTFKAWRLVQGISESGISDSNSFVVHSCYWRWKPNRVSRTGWRLIGLFMAFMLELAQKSRPCCRAAPASLSLATDLWTLLAIIAGKLIRSQFAWHTCYTRYQYLPNILPTHESTINYVVWPKRHPPWPSPVKSQLGFHPCRRFVVAPSKFFSHCNSINNWLVI